MPIVPTDDRALTLMGGATGPRASAEDFGSLEAEAVGSFARPIAQGGQLIAGVVEHRQRLANTRWVNDSMTRFQDYHSTWLADPANNTDLNYDMKYLEMAREMQSKYVGAAPNKVARAQLEGQLQNYVSSRYASAAEHANNLRTQDLVRSISERGDSVVRAYDTDRQAPGYDPNAGLLPQLEQHRAMIRQSLSSVAPQLATKLQDQATIDAAYAVMDHSPDLARKVLDEGGITGHARHVLDNAIRSAEDALAATDSITGNELVKNWLAMAEAGKDPGELPHGKLHPFFPRKHAEALESTVNAAVKTYRKYWEANRELTPKNPAAQARELQKYEDKVGNNPDTADMDKRVHELLTTKVHENIRLFMQDHVAYMDEHNPAISAAKRRLDDYRKTHPDVKSNDPGFVQAVTELDALRLKFTSSPPGGIPESEKDLFWPVARADQAVLSKSEAKATVASINGSAPRDVVATLGALAATHPGNTATVMTQLTKEGLDGAFWGMGKNLHHPQINELAGAVQAMRDKGAELNKDTVQEFKDALKAYGPWMQFSAAMPSVNGQLTGVTVGVQDMLVAYGMHLQRIGRVSPELAMKKSYDEWISGVMRPVSVNGQMLVFDRRGKTDAQLDSEGRMLGLLPRLLATQDLDLEEILFQDRPEFGNKMMKQQAIRDQVWATGFFMPSADTQTANLYMRGKNFTTFEVRDKKNRAIQVNLEDLKKMMTDVPLRKIPFSGVPGGYLYSGGAPEFIEPPVDLLTKKEVFTGSQQGGRVSGFGVDFTPMIPMYKTQTSTNWPVDPKFIRHVPAK